MNTATPTLRIASPSAPSNAAGSNTDADILRELFSNSLELEPLAHCLGIGVRDLANWADRPDTAALLTGVRRLSDERAELIVSRARTGAAHRLLELAQADDNPETARKACVDLLRLRDPAGAHASTGGAQPATLPTTVTAEANDLLGRLDELRRHAEAAD